MKALLFTICFSLAVLLVPYHTQAAKYSHSSLTSYKGPRTCATCHQKAVKEVAMSLHYQQAAEPKFVEGWKKGDLAGMMISY